MTRFAALAFAAFCVLTAILFHWQFADRNQLLHFQKDLAIAGGFLVLACCGPGNWSIGRYLTRSGKLATSRPARSSPRPFPRLGIRYHPMMLSQAAERRPMPPIAYCDDSMMAYRSARKVFQPGEGVVFDEGYRLAHLPLVNAGHPAVISEVDGRDYRNGTYEKTRYALVMPISADAFLESEQVQALELAMKSSSFAPKIAWGLCELPPIKVARNSCQRHFGGWTSIVVRRRFKIYWIRLVRYPFA